MNVFIFATTGIGIDLIEIIKNDADVNDTHYVLPKSIWGINKLILPCPLTTVMSIKEGNLNETCD